MNYNITEYQAKYIANFLTRRLPANDLNKLTASLQDAQVDLTPHQVEAALFAFKSPLSKGAILADEVGLGKTIEAGIILSQHWSEHKRRLLVICPANLRKQWSSELLEKFYLPSVIMESKSFNSSIENGTFNPFDRESIVICSLQFAKTKAAYIRRTDWDLVIIDEAHRLRNVYKPQNKTANAIKTAIESKKKILMTATPLQNSILELYGLVSIIDDYVFGDLKSFKSQFGHNITQAEFQELRRRLQPVCKRTLRRQVLEYIKYTKRIAIVEEFYPTENEQRLYDMVTEYLSKPRLYALPNSQRQLMTLILRKLLASSTYAIYGTFCSLINRLQDKLNRVDDLFIGENEVIADYEDDNDQWVDNEEAEFEEAEELHPDDIEGIKKEIEELKQFRDLAEKIKKAGIPQYTEEMNEIVDEWDDFGIFSISDKRNDLHKLKKIVNYLDEYNAAADEYKSMNKEKEQYALDEDSYKEYENALHDCSDAIEQKNPESLINAVEIAKETLKDLKKADDSYVDDRVKM